MPQLVISRPPTSAPVVPPPLPTIIRAPIRILNDQLPTQIPLPSHQFPKLQQNESQNARKPGNVPLSRPNLWIRMGQRLRHHRPDLSRAWFVVLLDQKPMRWVTIRMRRRGSVINTVGGLRNLEGRGYVCVVALLMRNRDFDRALERFA